MLELVRVRSVIDVGCGVGTWLRAFGEAGVTEYLGVDGDYVDRSLLEIDVARFRPHDLTVPLRLGRRFDLAMSLEVAEHLPSDAAGVLVDSLTELSDVVLFSAAVPNSYGHHHVNEQWPEYWAALFAAREYVVLDAIRPKLWCDDAVEWWYSQNAFLYVKAARVAADPRLQAIAQATDANQLARVHPRMLTEVAKHGESLRHVVRTLPRAAGRALLCRLPWSQSPADRESR